MLGLPKSTEFNKRIPKQKFYENIAVTPTMKKAFVEQIRIIYWRNKIAVTTLNLAAGEQVTEIEVFEVRLSTPELDESVLRQIEKSRITSCFCWNTRAGIGLSSATRKLRRVKQPLRLIVIIIRIGWMRMNFQCIWTGFCWIRCMRILYGRLLELHLIQVNLLL